MRFIRRWFLVAALAVAGTWVYTIAGSGAKLLAMLSTVGDLDAVVRSRDDPTSLAPAERSIARAEDGAGAEPPPAQSRAAKPDTDQLRQPPATDALEGAQIMRLLEDEIATDTDPAAADEFLRAFGESLDAP